MAFANVMLADTDVGIDRRKMRLYFFLASGASAEDYGRPTAILVSPLWDPHLRQGSIAVKVGDAMKAGARIGRLGNSGPFGSFTLVGAVDFDKSAGDRLVIAPQSRQIQSEYPLYGGLLNFPGLRP